MAPQAPQHWLETERLTAQHAPRPVIGLKDTIPQVIPRARASAFRRWGVISAVGSLGLAGVYLVLVLLSAAVGPRVTRITPITRSGKVDPWGRLVSDGARIYFLEREGDHWNLMQTSLNGGDPELVSAPFRNTRILDISPDNSQFLIASFKNENEGTLPGKVIEFDKK